MATMNYQYETSPRKLEPEYNKRKKTKNIKKTKAENQKNKNQIKLEKRRKQKQVAKVIGLFLIMLTISYRNSVINERFSEIQKQKEELASIEKINGQLEVKIESSVNLSNIEESAKSALGMQKLTNDQKVYVELPKKDYVETVSDEVEQEEEKSWFEELMDKIFK